jgi:hypothetical protein
MSIEELEARIVPTLLGQQLFPADYPWNQNIANAPVAANSAAIISHIGGSIGIHPDWGEDSATNGTSPLYGIPVNVVHGNSTAKVNVIIDNYPDESDIVPVPIPQNAVIEGDYQNGPNPYGPGYNNSNQRGDSHLIVWDEDNNVAYELFGAARPSDPTTMNGDPTGGQWHAAQESVWNMSTDSFRSLGWTSADAAGLSILAGLARPDEGLPIAQGGQGAIDHALRLTLPSGDVSPQYIYPASHVVSVSSGSTRLPFGSRLRLMDTPAVNAVINTLGPQAQVIAHAMQQYGLVLADIGSAMYVTGSSASMDANNQIASTWNMDDVLGLRAIKASYFDVVNLAPVVTGLSVTSGAAGTTVTLIGQNFSGSAGNLSVHFGGMPAPSVTYLDDAHITVVVPNGSGTVDVQVQSGVAATDPNNPNDNVNNPIFGYGTSARSAADLFTYSGQSVSGADSTAAFATSSIASGNTDTVTLVVQDTAGNPFSGLAGSAFQLSVAGGASTGTFSSVTETSTPGTYTASFTGVTAGSASTLTAKVNGVTLATQPTIAVTPGVISGATTTLSFASATDASGTADVLTIVVADAAGNAITGLSDSDFGLALSGGNSAGTFGTVGETGTPGTYTVPFTGTIAGSASGLTATVGGVIINAKPTIRVVAGAVSAAGSSASFVTPTVVSGKLDRLTLVVLDDAGNPVTGLGSTAFSFGLSGGASAGTVGPVVETTTKGTYTANFTGTTAGTPSALSATVNGVSLATQPAIAVSTGIVSNVNSAVTFASPTLASGTTDTLTIAVEDAAGNAIGGLPSSAFRLSRSSGTSAGVFTVVTETATSGTYTATLTGTIAGTASTVTASVNGVIIVTRPKLVVTPGAVSPTRSTVRFAAAVIASGKTELVTMAVKDAAGNAVTGLASSDFGFNLAGGAQGTFGSVTETTTKGTYTVPFTSTIAGTASALNITVTGVNLAVHPTVAVTSGVVNAVNSTLSFATDTVASRTVDTLTIVVRDAAGNSIGGLSRYSFHLSVAGGSSTGIFGIVTATATKGTYSVAFTGSKAGTPSTVMVSVNAIVLATIPTISVTAGAVSGTRSTAQFASPTVAVGSTDLVTLVIEDAVGNVISGLDSSAFALSLSGGTSAGTFTDVTETATRGVYTALFTATTAGTLSSLTTVVNGVTVSSRPTVIVSGSS